MKIEEKPIEQAQSPEQVMQNEQAESAATEQAEHPFRARMRGYGQFEDDNGMMDMAEQKYQELEQELNMYKLDNETIMDALEREPAVAVMLQEIGAGAPLRVAVARVLDAEDMTPQEGDDDFAAWEKNKQAYAENKTKRKQWQQSMDEAAEFTKAEAKAFAEERGWTPEQAADYFTKMGEFLQDIYAGKVSRKAMTIFEKAMTADEEVAKAKEQGIVEGKNTKIKTELVNKGAGDQSPIITSQDERAPEMPEPELKKGKRWAERIDNTAKQKGY